LPFGRDPLADIQLYHRLLAYAALGLVLWLSIEAFRSHRGVAGLPATALVLLVATVADGVVGAISVSTGVPPAGEIAHATATALTVTAATVMLVVARRGETIAAQTVAARPERLRLVLAYVPLTKPR